MMSIIVATDKNNAIGIDKRLPWKLPLDLAYFKKMTLGHTVVMGRNTYESIGKPLPGRDNWVMTKDQNLKLEGCSMFHSLEEVVSNIQEEEVFIIGGAKIYAAFFPIVERLYITWIDEGFHGDTFFPRIKEEQWKLVSETRGEKNEKNPYDYYYRIYERV